MAKLKDGTRIFGSMNVNTAIIIADSLNVAPTIIAAFGQANLAYATANGAQTWSTSAFARANTANITADRAFGQANLAFAKANTANITADVGFGQANLAFARANTANITADVAFNQANLAYARANTANITADVAFNQANLAYAKANTGSAGVSVNVGNVVPVSGNTQGSLWWNSDLGRLLIYYTDVDGSQWVDASPPGVAGPAGPAGANGTGGSGSSGAPNSKTISIPAPQIGDSYTLFWTNAALNVAEIRTVVQGLSPVANVSFYAGSSRASISNTINTSLYSSNTTYGNSFTALANTYIPANSFIWVTVDYVSGTVTEYHATMRFQ